MTTTGTGGASAPVGAAFSIGEVCARTGLGVDTVRFYEREGLFVHAVGRSPGGRRLYGEFEVEWLRMCTRLRASGMSLPDIRRYTELVRQGPGNEAERFALLRAHQDKVRAHLAELTACLDIISTKVDLYAAHLADGSASTLWTGEPGPCSGSPARPAEQAAPASSP